MATNGATMEPAAPPAAAESAATVQKLPAGELLFCGSTNWRMMGRSESKNKNAKSKAPQAKTKGKGKKAAAEPEEEEDEGKYPVLSEPHRISSLLKVDSVLLAAGCGTA